MCLSLAAARLRAELPSTIGLTVWECSALASTAGLVDLAVLLQVGLCSAPTLGVSVVGRHSFHHYPCQSLPVMAPRNRPVSNCVKAPAALPSRELCCNYTSTVS